MEKFILQFLAILVMTSWTHIEAKGADSTPIKVEDSNSPASKSNVASSPVLESGAYASGPASGSGNSPGNGQGWSNDNGPRCPGQYQCEGTFPKLECVETSELCDGNPDCPDGDDENDCPVQFCWSGCCTLNPHDCQDVYASGHNTSGVYTICPYGLASCTEAYCDFDTDGGGWTVFQRRQDGSVDFFLGWVDYQNGFGSAAGEYWLGNKYIHGLVSTGTWELRIDLEDFDGITTYAKYAIFYLAGVDDLYRLSIGGYSGDAGDSMTSAHNGKQFSTKDFGPSSGCSDLYKGGWWYANCHRANLNGLYLGGPHSSYADGVIWFDWKGYYYSLKSTTMMMRRL